MKTKVLSIFWGMAWLLLSSLASKAFPNQGLVHSLLVNLEQLQSQGTPEFRAGVFPAYREYERYKGRLKADENFFFTALILVQLNEVYPKLSIEDRAIVDRIRQKALPAFAYFQNKNGGLSYNFWSTQPPKIFPNSGWMNWFDRQQSLPDDFDDTVMGLLAKKASRSEAQEIHAYMQGFTNHRSNPVRNTIRAYKSIGAYSVWFGQKFPVDFDLSVLANTLYFVSHYQLTWTAADSASLLLLSQAIDDDLILTRPGFISPHYARTEIILYHLARLIDQNPDLLKAQQPKLKAYAKELYQVPLSPIHQALLSTTLSRLGITHEVPEFDSSDIEAYAASPFVFFIANMSSMLANPLKSIVGSTSIGSFNYYCPAHNLGLILESLLQ